ncbi:MAG: DUF3782 domain-containing protein [Thermodesulfovibrionales bacterium]|nr:DUF3782 domain-containing protein [Thermodesulfovibrionales bacterium]
MKKSALKPLTKTEIKKIILREVPRFVKKDPEIREFILKISAEKFADKKKTEDRFDRLLEELRKEREENQRKWEENQRKWEENQRRWEENQRHLESLEREWAKKWEENQRKWEENQMVINSILEEIKFLHRKYDTGIGALGSRWGLRAESSFRDAIKGILEEDFPVKVERYRTIDEEGIVFGKPDQVELDLIIKNGFITVAEIKSSISKGDVITFLRKVQVYEKK